MNAYDRLAQQHHELMNSFGRGSFRDGRTRERVEEIEALLAKAGHPIAPADTYAASLTLADDKQVTVCDKCMRACCWQGEFMCDEALGAGTVVRTVAELRAGAHGENEHYWRTT